MIEVLDNIQDRYYNEIIVDHLVKKSDWVISLDEDFHNTNIDYNVYSDHGFLNISFDEASGKNSDHFLNVSAFHIYNKVLSVLNFNKKNYSLIRCFWNYYNRSSNGIFHVDDLGYNKNYNYYSIIYYLTNSDGGTIIEDKFIQDMPGRAVIFESNKLHRGVSPTKSKQRFLLNMVFRRNNENST